MKKKKSGGRNGIFTMSPEITYTQLTRKAWQKTALYDTLNFFFFYKTWIGLTYCSVLQTIKTYT